MQRMTTEATSKENDYSKHQVQQMFSEESDDDDEFGGLESPPGGFMGPKIRCVLYASTTYR